MFDDVFLANTLFVVFFAVSLVPFFHSATNKRPWVDKFSMFWYLFTTGIHVVFEVFYIYMFFTADPVHGIDDSTNFLAAFWREYGKADARYGRCTDMEIFSIEIMAVCVFTPLAIINLYCAYKDSPSRHFFQVFLSAPHALGTYFYLYPEILRGAPNMNMADPIYKYYYIYFTNGLWIVIPLLLCLHSFFAISKRFAQTAPKTHTK